MRECEGVYKSDCMYVQVREGVRVNFCELCECLWGLSVSVSESECE